MQATIMNQDIEPGIRSGFWFFFDIDGRRVTVHNSAISGRERLWVDDELVAKRISWSKTNQHILDINGRAVGVTIALPSLRVPRVTCTVSHGGEQIAVAESVIGTCEPVSPWTLAASALLGGAAGYGAISLALKLIGAA